MKYLAVVFGLMSMALTACADEAPYDNTVYLEPDILVADDTSSLVWIRFDQEVTDDEYSDDCDGNFSGDEFYVFDALYSRNQSVEFYIDQRFRSARAAQDIVGIYAPILGQVPYILRKGVDVVIVRTEGDNWCATTGQIEIEHAEYRSELADGALEESMMHETVHSTLDDDHAGSPGWLQAQEDDGIFVSDYAQDSPDDEDLAETFTVYYGLIRGRLDDEDEEALLEAIPHRLDYLRKQFPLSRLSVN